MATRKIVYLVFVFPVVVSLIFGGFVLSDVLGQPDRKLNMWQFTPKTGQQGDQDIRILDLADAYPVSSPINFRIGVNNTAFDCGDLYLTVYDLNSSPKQIVLQQSYFSQCFTQGNLTLPIQDTFTPTIDKPGSYQIVAELKDKSNQNTLSVKGDFRVK